MTGFVLWMCAKGISDNTFLQLICLLKLQKILMEVWCFYIMLLIPKNPEWGCINEEKTIVSI